MIFYIDFLSTVGKQACRLVIIISLQQIKFEFRLHDLWRKCAGYIMSLWNVHVQEICKFQLNFLVQGGIV